MESLEKTKICTKCKGLPKPLSAFHKRSEAKDGHKSHCISCIAVGNAQTYVDHKFKIDQRNKQYNESNKSTILAYQKQYYFDNKKSIQFIHKQYRINNKSKEIHRHRLYNQNNKNKISLYHKIYRQLNVDRVNAACAKRRAQNLNATPKWLTKEDKLRISCFYTAAAFLTKVTGIKIEVDHIVPLQGKNVRGLHIPHNMQLLPRLINRAKGNKF